MKPVVKTIASQPSWVIRNDAVELSVTQLGGHMSPVTFYRSAGLPVQPYYISPWQDEGLDIDEPVLVPLRGDFFCMPFGAGSTHRGQSHVSHGESATKKWSFAGLEKKGAVTTLSLSMKTTAIPGKTTKNLSLVDGQNVVYSQHVLEGYAGKFPLGHHATLAMPEDPKTVHLATSSYRFGRTYPVPPGNPAAGEYYSVDPGKTFDDLTRVPMSWKDPAYGNFLDMPDRKGFVDLAAVFHEVSSRPAWTTAVFEKQEFLWFSLKDSRMLPSLIFWVENHGRHTEPWGGRNNCLGLEDVCAYFAMGLADSVKTNSLNREGVVTAVELTPKLPTRVNYIQGVVRVPRGFLRVREVHFAPGSVTFLSVTGKRVAAAVNHEFITTGTL